VLLKREGHNIRILERNSASLVSSQGAGLNAGPDVQQFMQEFDRTGLPYSLNPPTAQITDCTGRVIRTIESDQRSTDWSTLYYRLRANFDGLRSDYCEAPPETEQEGYALYMDGHCVSGMKYEDGHLTIEFNGPDGSMGSVDADLVIAADGPSSKIRQIMAPEIERRYVGYCGWRGTLPERDLSEEAKSLFNESITVCGIEKSFLTSLILRVTTLISNVHMR
jgi:2-polyprenyl-6-methoxyphenol hydroxylase-like FAD-dependent oxidoreductase